MKFIEALTKLHNNECDYIRRKSYPPYKFYYESADNFSQKTRKLFYETQWDYIADVYPSIPDMLSDDWEVVNSDELPDLESLIFYV